MKILFVIPNLTGDFYKAVAPPVGIASMVAVLDKNGHNAEALDMRFFPKMEFLDKKVAEFQPDMICIGIMSKDHKKGYAFINQVKDKYKKTLVIGGPHPSLFQEKVLKDCKADFAIMGEGEYAILGLANQDKYSKVPNLIWKDGDKIVKNELTYIQNLDDLPFPAYEKFPLNEYLDRKIPLVTSRGCPFSCIYCSIQRTMGKKWRPRSVGNIMEEIKLWKSKGYDFFHIIDDNFSMDRKRVEDFCKYLIDNRMNIKWDLRNGVRADTVDEKLLRLMKKAGCVFVAFGVESLDQEVLNVSKKTVKVEKVEEAVKASIKVGIKTGAFFIMGLPKDNFERFKKILKFVKENDFDEFEINNCVPYPGTEMEKWVKENGKFLVDPIKYLNYATYWKDTIVFETDDFTLAERKKAYRLAEQAVWKKLLKKEFGPLSLIAYPVWNNLTLRKYCTKPGFILWAFIRKLRKK
ncbi:MAG: radical SAM protein [archaeon]